MKQETTHIGILAGLAILAVVVFVGMQVPAPTAPATGGANDGYSLTLEQQLYENNLEQGRDEERSMFMLARIYYISGQTTKSLETIAAYKAKFPNEKRIHYVAGLAHAYAGNLNEAQDEFELFIDSGLATWPGHLDLAWVRFQQGDFDEAAEILDTAIAQFGDNAWLNTSRGAVALAQGERAAAIEYLTVAKAQAATLTQDEWHANYSLNNPANFESERAQMQAIIDTNLASARGEVNHENVTQALGAPFVSASPLGVMGGLAVSACGDSCTNTQCISGANVCGDVSVGTQSSCGGGGCSASVPANPSGTCSVPTECGVNATGFNGCSGQCNITQYPFCKSVENPEGDGEIQWITIDPNGTLGATDVTAQIFAVPALVTPGGSTVIRWLSTETDTCEVTSSSNDDVWEGIFGEELSSTITQQTTYTLVCAGFDGSTVTDTAVVEIVPAWQEF